MGGGVGAVCFVFVGVDLCGAERERLGTGPFRSARSHEERKKPSFSFRELPFFLTDIRRRSYGVTLCVSVAESGRAAVLLQLKHNIRRATA